VSFAAKSSICPKRDADKSTKKNRCHLFILLPVALAPAVDIQGMMAGSEIVEFAGSPYDLFDPGIAEFNHIPGLHVDQVIMLHATIGLFELGNVFSELMFDHQAAIKEEFNGIIKGGPAYPVIFVFHEDIERLYIKMAITGIDLIEYGVSFGCLSVSFLLQVICKYLFYSIFGFILDHN
jgi:hypothetical protein